MVETIIRFIFSSQLLVLLLLQIAQLGKALKYFFTVTFWNQITIVTYNFDVAIWIIILFQFHMKMQCIIYSLF